MIRRIVSIVVPILLVALAAALWHRFEKIPLAQHGQSIARPQATLFVRGFPYFVKDATVIRGVPVPAARRGDRAD